MAKSKRSSGAVAKAWKVFDKHAKADRKDAVEAAVRAGINISTAKTQYQRWMHASKAERAAKVNGEKKEAATAQS